MTEEELRKLSREELVEYLASLERDIKQVNKETEQYHKQHKKQVNKANRQLKFKNGLAKVTGVKATLTKVATEAILKAKVEEKEKEAYKEEARKARKEALSNIKTKALNLGVVPVALGYAGISKVCTVSNELVKKVREKLAKEQEEAITNAVAINPTLIDRINESLSNSKNVVMSFTSSKIAEIQSKYQAVIADRKTARDLKVAEKIEKKQVRTEAREKRISEFKGKVTSAKSHVSTELQSKIDQFKNTTFGIKVDNTITKTKLKAMSVGTELAIKRGDVVRYTQEQIDAYRVRKAEKNTQRELAKEAKKSVQDKKKAERAEIKAERIKAFKGKVSDTKCKLGTIGNQMLSKVTRVTDKISTYTTEKIEDYRAYKEKQLGDKLQKREEKERIAQEKADYIASIRAEQVATIKGKVSDAKTKLGTVGNQVLANVSEVGEKVCKYTDEQVEAYRAHKAEAAKLKIQEQQRKAEIKEQEKVVKAQQKDEKRETLLREKAELEGLSAIKAVEYAEAIKYSKGYAR